MVAGCVAAALAIAFLGVVGGGVPPAPLQPIAAALIVVAFLLGVAVFGEETV